MCITSRKCNSTQLHSVSCKQVCRLTPAFMLAAGTSSFGMSGANAHMLLGAPARVCDGPQHAVTTQWRNAHYWPVPPLSALLAAHVPPPGVSPYLAISTDHL